MGELCRLPVHSVVVDGVTIEDYMTSSTDTNSGDQSRPTYDECDRHRCINAAGARDGVGVSYDLTDAHFISLMELFYTVLTINFNKLKR